MHWNEAMREADMKEDRERLSAEAHKTPTISEPRITSLEACNVQVSIQRMGPDEEGFAVSINNDPDPFHFTKEQARALTRMLEMLK
jgi:hypothetical protein